MAHWQCCCQGLETQGRGQGQALDVQGRGLENWSSRTRTFLEDNNTAYWSISSMQVHNYLLLLQYPVCKSITAPPHVPPGTAGICILLVMHAVPKLLWATPPCLGKALLILWGRGNLFAVGCELATRVGGTELPGGWVLQATQHTTSALKVPPRWEGRA